MYRRILIMTILLTAAGCSGLQPEQRTGPPVDMPDRYTLYTAAEKGPDRWWQAFGSVELNRLVEAALSGNFDIQTAWTRLRQADAVARQAGAGRQPTVDTTASAEATRRQTRLSGSGPRETDSGETWTVGLAAAYEVDLWGRVRARQTAEQLNTQAAREDLEAAAVTIAAAVVETWIDILTARRQTAILRQQIQLNTDLLDLQRLRFANGAAKALDVSQQRQALAAVKADLPLLQRTEQQRINQLALQLGRASADGLEIKQKTLPALIPVPAAGLPADLLAARPDIRAAGLRLRSADWQVSAARADRLPAVALSGQAAFSSGRLDLLFSNWAAGLAASLTGPLFDGGRRSAEVDRTRAVARERLAAYAATVAGAVREVEDNLVGEARQREYLALLKDQLKAARLTLKAARLEYRNGQSDYLTYLTARTSVQNLERRLVGEQANLIKDRVALYRTLGGNWTGRLLPSDALQVEDSIKNRPS